MAPTAGRMTTASLRVGVAGLGTMGRNHLRNLRARAGVRVVAAADPSEHARAAVHADMPDVRLFEDPLQLLADEPLDALIIAAPTRLHHTLAVAALRYGIAVLVEKPIAATVEEGRDLVRVMGATGGFLQVGHVERFNPAIEALVARLRDGGLSQVHSIKTVREGPLPERIRDVGVGIDLATHDIDLMCLVVGERPIRAYAEATRNVHMAREDLLLGLLAFPGGAIGQVNANWLSPRKHRRMAVLGPEGLFEVDYLHQSLTFTSRDPAPVASYVGGFAPTFDADPVALPVTKGEPLTRELDAFFSAIRSGGPPPVSAEEGLWALVLAEALLTSAAENRAMTIEAPSVPA